MQLGRHPVAGVVTCYISTDYEDFTLKFRHGELYEKHVVTQQTFIVQIKVSRGVHHIPQAYKKNCEFRN